VLTDNDRLLHSLNRVDGGRELSVSLIELNLEALNSLILEFSKVNSEAAKLLRIVVVRLLLQEVQAFVGEGEGREQERLDREREESVLGFAAVLVHYIANDTEVNRVPGRALIESLFDFMNEAIALVVSVREHNHHDTVCDFFLLFSTQIFSHNRIAEEEHDELVDHGGDVITGHAGEATALDCLLPSGEVGFLELHHFFLEELAEFLLIELSHNSEAGSIEEELELLVVLLGLGLASGLLRLLYHRRFGRESEVRRLALVRSRELGHNHFRRLGLLLHFGLRSFLARLLGFFLGLSVRLGLAYGL